MSKLFIFSLNSPIKLFYMGIVLYFGIYKYCGQILCISLIGLFNLIVNLKLSIKIVLKEHLLKY